MNMADVSTTGPDASQAEGDGPEGSDKPPHGASLTPRRFSSHNRKPSVNGTKSPNGSVTTTRVSRRQSDAAQSHIPLPPPEANSYPKAAGPTHKDLAKLAEQLSSGTNGVPHVKQNTSSSTTGSISPSLSDSPSASESESWSLPSTQPPSRAPSFSTGKSGAKLIAEKVALMNSGGTTPRTPKKKEDSHKAPPSTKITSSPSKDGSTRSKGPPSIHSDTGGQKFTLKDLLGTPKLVRKSSARSTSSRKSDSDRGGKSEMGASTISLLKKYGVCEKIAIGKGATSVVRLAHKWDRSEEKLYAVKEFRKRRKNESEKEYVKKLTAEFCISSTLHHINVVETVDLVQDEQLRWCEVMEFCPGGDLYAAIKRGGMSPAEVECCFKQILTGVGYLHSQGVAHRDIKPENLFFDTKGHLKIGDYGASTVYRLPWESTIHMSTGLCGSEPYIAPEQFLGKPYDARLVDIWACAIVYYCLHFQELPWTVAQPTDPLFAAYQSACQSAVTAQSQCPPTINNLSPRACRPLIRKMLDPNPKLRCSIEEAIAHPWVQSIEVCYLAPKATHIHVYAQAMAAAQVQVVDS